MRHIYLLYTSGRYPELSHNTILDVRCILGNRRRKLCVSPSWEKLSVRSNLQFRGKRELQESAFLLLSHFEIRSRVHEAISPHFDIVHTQPESISHLLSASISP